MTDFSINKSVVWLNDQLIDFDKATIHIASAAVLYGLSVYTVCPITVTSQGLAVFRLKEHYQRLVESAQILGIGLPSQNWSYEAFVEVIRKLVNANQVESDVFVRATIHVSEHIPGTRSRGLATTLSMFIYPATSILPVDGARLKTTHWRRVPDISIPARAKVNGAYVNSVLGKQDALDSGYDDCIFLDANGHVCELSAANIFMVRGGALITPDTTSDILEGINRKSIIEYAHDLGIDVQERAIDLTELYIADEVFACGTSAYLTPVLQIDNRTIGSGTSGPITEKLSRLHSDNLHGRRETKNLVRL